MSWFVFAIIAALFTSAASLTEKKILFREHAMEFSAALAFINAIITLPLFFFIDYAHLEITPFVILFFTTILAAVAYLFVAKSMRHMEISFVSPFFALSPGVVALLAFLFLREALSLFQISGIGLLLIGAYILETKHSQGLFDPLKELQQSKYKKYLFIALLLYSITVLFDRYILSHYYVQPTAYLAVAHIFVAFHFFILIKIFHDGFKGVKHGFQNAGKFIFLAAFFTTGYRLAQLFAIQVAFVGLVVSVKRLSTFFTTIIGGELFHEHNLVRKSIATVIILCGVVLIII